MVPFSEIFAKNRIDLSSLLGKIILKFLTPCIMDVLTLCMGLVEMSDQYGMRVRFLLSYAVA
jgi:thiol:disulfide interchange protein